MDVGVFSNFTNFSDIVIVRDWKTLCYVLSELAPFSLAVDRFVTPIWCVMGVLGNLISVRVWTLRRMRKCNTSAAYLATLAFSDLLFLILLVGNELQYPWMVGALDLQGWCQVWNVLQMATQYTSILLVLAFTVERFISVYRPFSCEKFSKTSRSSKIIIAIVCTSFLLALPQAVFWNVGDTGECTVRNVNSTAFDQFYSTWNWSSELVMFGGVPVIAFALNVCVLRQVRTVGRIHAASRCTSTTATLVGISFYLILSKLPVTIVFSIQSSIRFGEPMSLQDMAHDPTWQNYLTYITVRKIIEELGISHHACNVFIYAGSSKQFRAHAKLVLWQFLGCKGFSSNTSPQPHPIRQRHHWTMPKS
ncbi:orphan G-protein coupled receptor 50 [Plakobranchus ocellatus]|uniref:Orphan G-protein coupled receptor 50 n=1 Tax=Plakobranchus ocellatus TaxID=259542 RepID=A0AAV4D1F2_9GAST|nr:orphan G-protein coupled receptor 50 [Plakobranchus ocellatus]